MYKVEAGLFFDDLTEEEQENVPDLANYIRITDDQGTRVYSDAMEPEDVSFFRDLSWIARELETAYNKGKGEAQNECCK